LKFEAGDTIEEIREKIEHNGYNFTVDHNWVYDMPPEAKETFFCRRLPLFPRGDHFSDEIGPLAAHLDRQLAAQFDWRNYNGHSYIGPIRDQGNCGSCYAFGAGAAAEGTYNWAELARRRKEPTIGQKVATIRIAPIFPKLSLPFVCQIIIQVSTAVMGLTMIIRNWTAL
jgi:hypothetical protein